MERDIRKAYATFQEFIIDPEAKDAPSDKARRIPMDVLAKAKGIGIVTLYQIGMAVIGMSLAGGIATTRLDDGSWSGPVAFAIESLSLGFEGGFERVDLVFVFLRPPKELLLHKYIIGSSGAGVVLGGFGFHDDIVNEDEVDDNLYMFARPKGLFGGLVMKEGILRLKALENKLYYGRDVSMEDVLDGKVKAPDSWYNSEFLALLKRAVPAYNPEPPKTEKTLDTGS